MAVRSHVRVDDNRLRTVLPPYAPAKVTASANNVE